jgi:hypothetical protein
MASSSSTTTASSSATVATAGEGVPPGPLLSDYEQMRARNIERVNAKLRSLGLIGQEEERASNDLAWGRHPNEKNKATKRSRPVSSSSPPREGSRKSRRLANQPAPGDEGGDEAAAGGDDDDRWRNLTTKERRAALVAECREARLRAANEVAAAGFDAAETANPTASYEHCLMRVRTMTEKALANRVRDEEMPTMLERYLLFRKGELFFQCSYDSTFTPAPHSFPSPLALLFTDQSHRTCRGETLRGKDGNIQIVFAR